MKHFGIEVKTSATKEAANDGGAKGARNALPMVRASAALCEASLHSGIQSKGEQSKPTVPRSAARGQTSCMLVMRCTVSVSQ